MQDGVTNVLIDTHLLTFFKFRWFSCVTCCHMFFQFLLPATLSCDPQVDERVASDMVLEREFLSTCDGKLSYVDRRRRSVFVDRVLEIDIVFCDNWNLPTLQEGADARNQRQRLLPSLSGSKSRDSWWASVRKRTTMTRALHGPPQL